MLSSFISAKYFIPSSFFIDSKRSLSTEKVFPFAGIISKSGA